MTLAFDLPTVPTSPLSRLDPRWKLAALAPAALAFALLQTPAAAVLALLGAFALALLARLPPRWLALRLGAALLLLALLLLWRLFVVRADDATCNLGPLTLSLTGLVRVLTLLARAAAVVTLALVLLATAPLHETFRAAHQLRVPGVLVQLALLTLRYVGLLAEEFARLRTALRVRGFRSGVNRHTYRTVGQLAGTLLVRSHERSERVAQAMRCRGFDGQFRSLHEARTTRADVLAFVLVLGYAGALLLYDGLAR